MRKIILTSAVLLTAALGASTFALAEKASGPDREARHASMCSDRSARAVGHLAELEAKLKPTTAQTAAWTAYKNTLTTQAATAEKSCLDRVAARKAAGDTKKRPTIIERNAMMEKGLEAKLASLKATQPSLTALYATLNDDQKQVMDRQAMRHGKFAGRHGGKHHGGMDHKARFERHHDKQAAPEAPAEQ